MEKKTAIEVNKEMIETGILVGELFSNDDYRHGIYRLQDYLAYIFTGSEERVHMSELIISLEKKVESLGIKNNANVRAGMNSLYEIDKEARIITSGFKGENRIHKTIEYCEREDVCVFRNVPIHYGSLSEETDCIVLTREGLMVLEIKTAKNNVTISSDGYLLQEDHIRYEGHPVVEKINSESWALSEILSEAALDKGMNIDIPVMKLIVISTPPKVRVAVTNNCDGAKFCFKSNVNRFIENYHTDTYYSDDEFELLKNLLEKMSLEKRLYPSRIDMGSIRVNISKLYEEIVLNESTNNNEQKVTRHTNWFMKLFSRKRAA